MSFEPFEAHCASLPKLPCLSLPIILFSFICLQEVVTSKIPRAFRDLPVAIIAGSHIFSLLLFTNIIIIDSIGENALRGNPNSPLSLPCPRKGRAAGLPWRSLSFFFFYSLVGWNMGIS